MKKRFILLLNLKISMKATKSILFFIFLVLLLAAYFSLVKNDGGARDYKDATYTISGKEIKLRNGYSKIEIAPGSASKLITRYFGNEIRKDINEDGREDVVFLLTQE